jgi:hypothetical protein
MVMEDEDNIATKGRKYGATIRWCILRQVAGVEGGVTLSAEWWWDLTPRGVVK